MGHLGDREIGEIEERERETLLLRKRGDEAGEIVVGLDDRNGSVAAAAIRSWSAACRLRERCRL